MRNAIIKVFNNGISVNGAATPYKVPKTTLKRTLNTYESTEDLDKATEEKMNRVFCNKQDKKLASYVNADGKCFL